MGSVPDWIDLVERARTGDAVAQGSLLVQFTPLVRATASRLVGPGDVDDVSQEAFAVAIAKLAHLRVPEAFPAWLRLIVRKQAQRLRQPTTMTDVETLDASDDLDPADVATRRDVAAIVRVALNDAPDGDRLLLELRYLAGWTNSELAAHLGITPGATRKRLFDARRRLRPALEHLDPKETLMTDLERFLGHVHGPDVVVPDAPALREPPRERTVTGLKVIDTVAPIRRGGTIEMTGPAGTGQVVVALELLYRLGRTPNEVTCVAIGVTGAALGSQPDLGHIVTEPGIPGANAAILCATTNQMPAAFESGVRLAAGLAAAGRDVVLLVDGSPLDPSQLTHMSRLAGLVGDGAVTVVVIRAVPRGDEVPPGLDLDTTLVFSLEQFALGIFPAIDPARSSSILPTAHDVAAVRTQLDRAARTRAWFHQDLFVAADFTGHNGTWINPQDAEHELRALLDH